MQIPERVKRFLQHTNSFAVIVEEGKPVYLVSSFEWAERVLLGVSELPDTGLDGNKIEEANKDFSLVVAESAALQEEGSEPGLNQGTLSTETT